MAEQVKAVTSVSVNPPKKTIQEYKKDAEGILGYCEVEDERKVEIIEKMEKYIKDRECGKLSEITGDEKRLINDAIHGPIKLTPLIYQMINTKEFHRLKYLRQQGGAHYVYPGANHTRFEHSIGVYHIAGVFARSLRDQLELDKKRAPKEDKKLYEFHDEEILCAEIAGLCHDLGHGPMSHMFESVMEETLDKDVKHERISVSMFKRLLTHHEVLGEFVHSNLTRDRAQLIEHMICPPDKEHKEERERLFLYEIVANKDTGIDVDKWDYYQRDCHYLGILQDFEWKRTMLLARIVMTYSDEGQRELHVGFRDKEMDNLYGMFRTRANIYRKACKHKTVKAVERMFIDAMVLVQDLEIVWAPSDKDPKKFKSIKEAIVLAIKDEPELDWYMSMTDSIVDIIMSADPDKDSTKTSLTDAKRFLTRIEQRDLYKRVAKIKVAKFDLPMKLLKAVHKQVTNCTEVSMAQELYDCQDERKKFNTCVRKYLQQTTSESFEEKDTLLEVVKIKHPSEKEENPLHKVFCFEKPRDPNCLPVGVKYEEAQNKASRIMVPQAFIEYEVRIYDTRDKDKISKQHVDHKKFQEAMNKAWEDLRAKTIAKTLKPNASVRTRARSLSMSDEMQDLSSPIKKTKAN